MGQFHGRSATKHLRNVPYLAPATSVSILDFLFAFSIIVYPANAAVALDILGEARSEPYILLNLLLAPFAILYLHGRGLKPDRLLLFFALSFLGAVAASALINFGNILSNEAKGRTGLSRLLSGTMVPMFGFYFSYLVYSYSILSFRRFLMGPLFWGALVVIGVGNIEVVSWIVDPVYNAYVEVSRFLHALMRRGQFIPGRVQSITFEASNFGMYAIFTLPWLWVFANQYEDSFRRALCWLLLVNLVVLSFLSGRTSLIGTLPVILIMICMRHFATGSALSFKIFRDSLIIVFLFLNLVPIALVALFQDEIAASVLTSENVSNVSRFGTIAIQIREFFANPIFGVGMGQYPYSVNEFFPSWALTWEFQKWINDPDASFYPSFSIFSRIAAELGSIGYIVWFSFSGLLLRNVIIACRQFWLQNHIFPYIGTAIVCGFFGVQFSGWVIASYKIPYIWFSFGFAVAYYRMPEFRKSHPSFV